MASEALAASYTTSAAVAYNATASSKNVAALRYLIANRGTGYLQAWCTTDAAGVNKVGSAIAVAPGAMGLLVSPVASGAVAIVVIGETGSGTADVMPVNTPQ